MHERCSRPTFSPLAVSAAVSALLLSGIAEAQQAAPAGEKTSEMASRGQRSLVRQIKYGDWSKVCFKTPSNDMVCRTSIMAGL